MRTGAVLWAISTDTLELHERMAKSYALSFPLLADEGGKVAAQYGDDSDAIQSLGLKKKSKRRRAVSRAPKNA